MKPITLSPLDQQVIANATGYFAWHRVNRGVLRTPFYTEAEAREQAKFLATTYGGKALVNAVDGLGGSACMASYSAKQGWNG